MSHHAVACGVPRRPLPSGQVKTINAFLSDRLAEVLAEAVQPDLELPQGPQVWISRELRVVASTDFAFRLPPRDRGLLGCALGEARLL